MTPRKGWQIALAAVLVLALIVAGGVVIYRVFYAPERAAEKVQTAKVETATAKVQTEIAKDAVAVNQRQVERVRTIERITHENSVRIMAAPGADNPIAPAVDREFLAALCLRRQATRADPACAGLSGVDRADPRAANAVSTDTAVTH
jgi:hypothetical protein